MKRIFCTLCYRLWITFRLKESLTSTPWRRKSSANVKTCVYRVSAKFVHSTSRQQTNPSPSLKRKLWIKKDEKLHYNKHNEKRKVSIVCCTAVHVCWSKYLIVSWQSRGPLPIEFQEKELWLLASSSRKRPRTWASCAGSRTICLTVTDESTNEKIKEQYSGGVRRLIFSPNETRPMNNKSPTFRWNVISFLNEQAAPGGPNRKPNNSFTSTRVRHSYYKHMCDFNGVT